MQRYILAACATLVLLANPSLAEERFAGMYAGISSSFAGLELDGDPYRNGPYGGPLGALPLSGASAGIRLGADHQYDRVVVGVIADANFGNISGNEYVDWCWKCAGYVDNVTTTATLTFLGTLRGRIGITVAPQVLAYATGGLAMGQVTIHNDLEYDAVTGVVEQFTETVTTFGFGSIFGIGIEVSVTEKLSVGGELLRHNLRFQPPEHTRFFPGTPSGTPATIEGWTVGAFAALRF